MNTLSSRMSDSSVDRSSYKVFHGCCWRTWCCLLHLQQSTVQDKKRNSRKRKLVGQLRQRLFIWNRPRIPSLMKRRVFSRPGIHSSLAWSSGEHGNGCHLFHTFLSHALWDRKGRDVSYDAPVVKAHQFPQHFEFNAVGQERKRCKL